MPKFTKKNNLKISLFPILAIFMLMFSTACTQTQEISTENLPISAEPTGSALGKLVEGFPSDKIAVPEKTDIKSSSVEIIDQIINFSLTAETEKNIEEIINFYTNKLESENFTLLRRNENPETTSLVFIKNNDNNLINLSIRSSNNKQIFSINGNLQN